MKWMVLKWKYLLDGFFFVFLVVRMQHIGNSIVIVLSIFIQSLTLVRIKPIFHPWILAFSLEKWPKSHCHQSFIIVFIQLRQAVILCEAFHRFKRHRSKGKWASIAHCCIFISLYCVRSMIIISETQYTWYYSILKPNHQKNIKMWSSITLLD